MWDALSEHLAADRALVTSGADRAREFGRQPDAIEWALGELVNMPNGLIGDRVQYCSSGYVRGSSAANIPALR